VESGVIPDYSDGFSVRMIWGAKGELIFYVYHQDQKSIYGDGSMWNNFKFVTGQWYNITFRIVLNTVNDNVGSNDGILEGFIDGKLMIQLTNFRFRNYENINIDNIYNCSFFGGNDESFASQRDEWIDVDNFLVYRYSNDVLDVPRGQETSSWSKTLLHPYHDFLDEDWKKSFKASSYTSSAVTLSWTDYPFSTGYTLERSINGGSSFTAIAALNYGTKTYSDTDIKPGTSYTYRLKAYTSTSYTVNVTTPSSPLPEAPTNLSSGEITKTSVKLSWIDNADNESGYIVTQSASSDFSSPATYTLASNTTTFLNSNLSSNTVYYYKVTAYNNAGSSASSNTLKIQTLNPSPPAAPTNLVYTSVLKYSLSLGWTDNANTETGVYVERSLSSSSGFTVIDTLPANSVAFTDDGLSLGTLYYYRIRAFNDDGLSAYSNVLEIRTLDLLPPTAPSDLVCTSVYKHAITLNWKDNSFNETGTYVEKYVPSSGFVTIDTLPANALTYSDHGLKGGTKYFYRTRAFNYDGISNYSNIVEVQTLTLTVPDPPYNLSAQQLNNSATKLTWEEDNDNEEGFELVRCDSGSSFFLLTSLDSNTLSYADTNLRTGWLYQYKIRAYNPDGFSSYSEIIEVTTPSLYPPAAPSDFRTMKIDYDKVDLAWNDNSNNETGFIVERTNPDQSLKELKVSLDKTAFSDTNLLDNSNYIYHIRAYNDDGNSYASEILQVHTPKLYAPQAPSQFRAIEFTANSLTINWKDNSDNESGFILKRYLNGDPDNMVEVKLPENDTVYTDFNLAPNTTYVYEIYAINIAGKSPDVNSLFSTLSVAENARVKDSLIAYYNFTRNAENIVVDLSNYKEPINLRIDNPTFITWDKDHKLTLTGNTLVHSEIPARKIIEACKRTNAFSVEMWVKPLESYSLIESYLLSIDKNEMERAFVTVQNFSNLKNTWDYSYATGLQTESTGISGLPYLDPSDCFSYINLNHIVYCIDELGQEKIYINGVKYAEGYRPGGFSSWENNYFLRLGNSEDLTHPWYGTYYLLAIYNIALSEEAIKINYSAGPMDNMEMNPLNYKINIFPNPAHEIVNIELVPTEEYDVNEETTLRIIDLNGVTRFEEVVFNPSRYYLKTLTVTNLVRGIYLVQISNGSSYNSATFILR
jgi:hypothetical protein